MESIKLDLIPGKKMPSLHASQYDDGREHGIDLFENGVVYKLDGTEKLTINERKVDNNICSMDIENTFTGSSHIEFASFLQMCACAGSNFCELRISKGDVDIGTLNFILEVEPDPTADGIESESEIRNLERQIEEITEEVIGDDYYTKTQTDNAIATAIEGKADTTYVNEGLAKKADKTDTYTKTQVDNALANKMDKANPTGTGSLEVGNRVTASGSNAVALGKQNTASGSNAVALGFGATANHKSQVVFGEWNELDDSVASPSQRGKYIEIVGNGTAGLIDVNRSNARTLDWQGNETLAGNLTFNGSTSLTGEISRLDGRITNLPKAVVFKGTLGVGGTIQSLPTASAENEGWMFKCITAGTYAGLTLKVGDTVTCFNPPNTSTYYWDKTGSADTDTDTWRNIKVNGTEKLGSNISSGSVDFVGSENIEVEFDSNGNKVGVKTKNIYTKTEVDSIVSDAIYNVLPDDTASGSVANFNTSLELPLKSLEIDVNAVQEAGTPTPSSPKAISGWSAITLDANGTTEVINLGGTYYGGHFTQDKAGHRQFVVTWCGLTDLGSLPWGSASNGRIGCNPTDMAVVSSGAVIGNIKSDCYAPDTQNNVYNRTNDKTIAMTNNLSTRMMLYDSDLGNKTSEEVKAALSGKNVIYELLEPYTMDLPDGEPIITLNGTNNIYADTGDSTVVFKSSVNDYVSAHSGGNLLGMGGVYLGGAKSGGSEEETDEGENTEKTKGIDEPKEEIKTIGDTKKLGGE